MRRVVNQALRIVVLLMVLTKAEVEINRKMLAELAVNDSKAFDQLVAVAKNGNGTPQKKATKAKKADFVDAIILIDGIGPKAEEALAKEGITKLTQLVKMKAKDIAALEEAIGKPGIV